MKHKHRSVMAGLLLCLPLWGAWAGPGAADMDRLLGMNAVDYATARNWVQDAAGLAPGDLTAGRGETAALSAWMSSPFSWPGPLS